jgi:hypothetical protein
MLNAAIIKRYGIRGIYDRTTTFDDLFCGGMNDPEVNALDDALKIATGNESFDIVFAIGPRRVIGDVKVFGRTVYGQSNLVVQTIIFRGTVGVQKYKSDGVLIFDDKQ